jgi:flavin reductase (DIM6/NTAB) family NADH-FMN oxidoreductase RutF
MTAVASAALGIDSHQFRALLRRHATTVTVITAPGSPPAGFTATSFTSVSLHPQLVAFSLDRASSSWPAIEQATHVAIHFLRAGQQATARTFATSGIDRFAEHTTWRPGPYGLPLLDNALAILTCAVVERVVAGDHAIVLSRPVAAHHDDGDPLLYHMGTYAAVAR